MPLCLSQPQSSRLMHQGNGDFPPRGKDATREILESSTIRKIPPQPRPASRRYRLLRRRWKEFPLLISRAAARLDGPWQELREDGGRVCDESRAGSGKLGTFAAVLRMISENACWNSGGNAQIDEGLAARNLAEQRRYQELNPVPGPSRHVWVG